MKRIMFLALICVCLWETADSETIGSNGGQLPTGAGTAANQTAIIAAITAAALPTPLPVKPYSLTPAAGTAHSITTGGTARTLVTGPVNGCQIVNPLSATDQGISTAEVAYIDPTTTATTTGNGTNTTIQPGQTWNCPGAFPTGVNVSVNAATTSHAFTVLVW